MACPNSDTLSTQCSSLSRSTTWPSVAVFRHSSNVDEGRYDAPHRYNSFRIDYSLPGNVVTVKMLAGTGCWYMLQTYSNLAKIVMDISFGFQLSQKAVSGENAVSEPRTEDIQLHQSEKFVQSCVPPNK